MKLTMGERFRLARVRKGLTQRELAKLAGISNTAISYVERNNHSVTLETARMLADALGVSLDYLAGRRDEP